MKMNGSINVVSVFVFVSLVLQIVMPVESLTCGDVDGYLAPCVSYLVSGGTPSSSCCGGVKSIKDRATTLADKQAACECIKDAANHYPNLKDDAAAALPGKCNVPLDIPVSRNTNCQNIHYVEATGDKL